MNESQSKVESNSIKDVHVRIDFPDVSGKQSARSGKARARSPVARIRKCCFRAICSPPSYNKVHIHSSGTKKNGVICYFMSQSRKTAFPLLVI